MTKHNFHATSNSFKTHHFQSLGKIVISAFALNASSSPPIPPPPPISVPVYSLASPIIDNVASETTKGTSMNILTFATPVSVSDPKLWIVSLYNQTLTQKSFFQSKVAVLQLLTEKQAPLVDVLGKRSGMEEGFSKEDACAEKDFSWISESSKGKEKDGTNSFYSSVDVSKKEKILIQSLQLLPQCQSYIKLRYLKKILAGDHQVALCQVLGVGFWNEALGRISNVPHDELTIAKDEASVLYTSFLRKKSII